MRIRMQAVPLSDPGAVPKNERQKRHKRYKLLCDYFGDKIYSTPRGPFAHFPAAAKVSRPKFAPREHSGQRLLEIRGHRSRLLKEQERAGQQIREKRWRLLDGRPRLSASWPQRIVCRATAKRHRHGLRRVGESTLKYRHCSQGLLMGFTARPSSQALICPLFTARLKSCPDPGHEFFYSL
jgi:hypothetical protein